jgi:hypothetical protein
MNKSYLLFVILFGLISYYLIFLYSPYFYVRSTGSYGKDFLSYQLIPLLFFVYLCLISNEGIGQSMASMTTKMGFDMEQFNVLIGAILVVIYLSINSNAFKEGRFMFNWFNNTNIKNTTYAVEGTEYADPLPLIHYYPNGRQDNKDLYLRDFFICSSYHTPVLTKDRISGKYIVSPYAITGAIKRGARFIHMDVMGDSFSPLANPVVGVCREKGNSLESLNTMTLEQACNAIKLAIEGSSGCMPIRGDYTSRDPILVYFRTKFDNRNDLEKKMAHIITEKLDRYLLPSSYSFTNFKINQQPIKQLLGKIIIITDRHPNTNELSDITNVVMCGRHLNEFKKSRKRYNDDENDRIRYCLRQEQSARMEAINNSKYNTHPTKELLNSTGNPNILAVFPDDMRMKNMTPGRIRELQEEGVCIIPLMLTRWNDNNHNYLNSPLPKTQEVDDLNERSFKNCGYILKKKGLTPKIRYERLEVDQPNGQSPENDPTPRTNTDNSLGIRISV